jgi:hypothetical protein
MLWQYGLRGLWNHAADSKQEEVKKYKTQKNEKNRKTKKNKKNINENKKSFSFIRNKDNFTSDFHTFYIVSFSG